MSSGRLAGEAISRSCEERGVRNPSYETLLKLAKALRIELGALVSLAFLWCTTQVPMTSGPREPLYSKRGIQTSPTTLFRRSDNRDPVVDACSNCCHVREPLNLDWQCAFFGRAISELPTFVPSPRIDRSVLT